MENSTGIGNRESQKSKRRRLLKQGSNMQGSLQAGSVEFAEKVINKKLKLSDDLKCFTGDELFC